MYEFIERVASEYMTSAVKAVARDVTMRELAKMFERDDFNAYPVRENGHVVGLVTKFDFLNCFAFMPNSIVPHYDDLMRRTVADVMTSEFIYVSADTRLTRVLQLMVNHRIRSMPVMSSEHQLLGIIAREDVMRALNASVHNS